MKDEVGRERNKMLSSESVWVIKLFFLTSGEVINERTDKNAGGSNLGDGTTATSEANVSVQRARSEICGTRR